MKLQFIGTGGAFAPIERGQSNMLLTSGCEKHLLIDCGMTAPYKLTELGISAADINAVYISHLHADHIGGMEWLAFSTYFNPSTYKPTLFCERVLMKDLWERSLRGGMQCLQGIDADLSTYFDCQPVTKGRHGSFRWEGYTFRLVSTLHVVGGFHFNDSWGLMIHNNTRPDKKTFITTDTQFTHPCPLQFFYETHEGFKSGVHAHYDDMNQFLDEETKAKMVLYHHGEERDTVEEDGFKGFAKTFDTFEI